MTAPITLVNPATGEVSRSIETHSADQVSQALRRAHLIQQAWRLTTMTERSAIVHSIAELLTERRDELALVATSEMGKPLREALGEVDKCASGCRYFADNAPGFLADREIEVGNDRSYVSYAPAGVVLAIMPWNFPYWQVIRFLAPALMAGNAGLLKHAPNVSGCAIALEQVVRDAGAPPDLFSALLISETDAPTVMQQLINDPMIAAVTLTGSERAGAAVGAAAGRALKKSVLELGGSDPFIVLDDADLELTVAGAVKGRFANAGQSCISAKRFIVAESVAEEFEQRFAAAVGALRVGDPTDSDVDVGPLARADLRDALVDQIDRSVTLGARIVSGGSALDGPGFFVQPTVLADVTPEMPAFSEETFGPLAALMRADSERTAIRLANATRFGLGASIWTRDAAKAEWLGQQITSGALFVNTIVASDPRVPFGGTKSSGYGRELAEDGVREFTEIRTFWIANGSSAS